MLGTRWGCMGLRLADAGVVGMGLWLALVLRGLPFSSDYLLLMSLAIVLFWFLAETHRAYTLQSRSMGVVSGAILQAWFWTVVVLLALGWMCKCAHRFSRLALGGWGLLVPVGLVLLRGVWLYGLPLFYTRAGKPRKAVFIGWNGLAHRLVTFFQENPHFGIQPVAVLAAGNPHPVDVDTIPVRRCRTPEEIRAFFEREGVDLVFLASSHRHPLKTCGAWLNGPCDVYVLPEIPLLPFLNPRPEEFGGIPCWALFASPLQGPARWIKRLEDLLVGSLALLVFLPVMALIAVAIRLDSPGPILFRQRRYGMNGKVFWMWKFRTMTVVEDGHQVKPATWQDRRVTRVGRWLRRFSLDELPQLFNVIRGEMSLVGPRPFPMIMDEEFRRYVEGFILRYRVKPGMTGWAQVHGWRGEIKTKEDLLMRLQYDLYYIHNWSLWLDLKILWMTIWRGFYHPKAY